MRSEATTVEGYLQSLPAGRREAITHVLQAVRARLPRGYEEAMNWGMITWQVPLSVCPDTYNGQPLMYAALASQKQHMAVYLTAVYMDEARHRAFVDAWRATGKRLDMGKSCIRFRRLEDLPLQIVVDSIAALPVEEFVAGVRRVQSAHPRRRPR